MRCYICDNELSENEIVLGPDHKSEPCTACMKVILETAYSDGYEIPGNEEHIEEIDDEEACAID